MKKQNNYLEYFIEPPEVKANMFIRILLFIKLIIGLIIYLPIATIWAILKSVEGFFSGYFQAFNILKFVRNNPSDVVRERFSQYTNNIKYAWRNR